MGTRGGFGLLCAALAGALLVACGGGGGDDDGQGERVTDPAEVPSSTPISAGQPQKYEIHQDGSLVITGGGPTVTGTVTGGATPGTGSGYTVVSGDTCGAIASAHGITADELIAANRAAINADCTNLHEGDELKIPGASGATATPRSTGGGVATTTPRAGSRTYTVESGDTCSDIAANQGVSVDDLIELNDLDPGCTNLQNGQVLQIPG
ncbi:MAG: LysM peptidoglycan-binding domain-containing protein [Dehalococcoidia bacterium]